MLFTPVQLLLVVEVGGSPAGTFEEALHASGVHLADVRGGLDQAAMARTLDEPDLTPGGNYGGFIAACRANDPSLSNAGTELAHLSSLLGHAMNNSYRIGRPEPFNKKAGRFGDNEWANLEFQKFHEVMRDGVGLPEDEEQYIVGPWLALDKKTERFVGEHADEANKLVADPRTSGFEIPTPETV